MHVWVNVRHKRYRAAYRKALSEENIDERVLSHALNRRATALKGFQFVRVTPTSKGANSRGGLTEQLNVDHHSNPKRLKHQNRSATGIQYADSLDLLLMTGVGWGGGVQNAANEGQALVVSKSRDSIIS